METHENVQVLESVSNKENDGVQDCNLLADAHQPALRLIKSETFDLCNSYNLSAASPRGSLVRRVSMSQTEEAANPTSPPISASVIPISRRSEMRDAHVVMPSSLRPAVEISQRHTVTAIRDNMPMPRPPDLPRFSNIGPRILWWRKRRGFTRSVFAEKIGMSTSGLADLENNRSKKSLNTHLIAAELHLNPHYLQTDNGEPEAEFAQEAPAKEAAWPFESVPKNKLTGLTRIERSYAESKLLEALAEIEAERRKAKRHG